MVPAKPHSRHRDRRARKPSASTNFSARDAPAAANAARAPVANTRARAVSPCLRTLDDTWLVGHAWTQDAD